MPPSPAKKPTFNDILKALIPDQVEAAYADVEKFVTHKARQFSDKEAKEFAATLKKLIDQSGAQVEKALYYMLCDPTNVARADIKKAMDNSTKAAIALVVTLLVGQFALAPATALILASIVVKIFAAKGQEKVCAEMKARKAGTVGTAGTEGKPGTEGTAKAATPTTPEKAGTQGTEATPDTPAAEEMTVAPD